MSTREGPNGGAVATCDRCRRKGRYSVYDATLPAGWREVDAMIFGEADIEVDLCGTCVRWLRAFFGLRGAKHKGLVKTEVLADGTDLQKVGRRP